MRLATIRHTGFAGHFICAQDCRFHLRTEVGGRYVVTTVGAMVFPHKEKDGWQEIGSGRLFETMVFKLGGPCDCPEKCGERKVSTSWSELDFQGYKTPADAVDGHNAMVTKWATKYNEEGDEASEREGEGS